MKISENRNRTKIVQRIKVVKNRVVDYLHPVYDKFLGQGHSKKQQHG